MIKRILKKQAHSIKKPPKKPSAPKPKKTYLGRNIKQSKVSPYEIDIYNHLIIERSGSKQNKRNLKIFTNKVVKLIKNDKKKLHQFLNLNGKNLDAFEAVLLSHHPFKDEYSKIILENKVNPVDLIIKGMDATENLEKIKKQVSLAVKKKVESLTNKKAKDYLAAILPILKWDTHIEAYKSLYRLTRKELNHIGTLIKKNLEKEISLGLIKGSLDPLGISFKYAKKIIRMHNIMYFESPKFQKRLNRLFRTIKNQFKKGKLISLNEKVISTHFKDFGRKTKRYILEGLQKSLLIEDLKKSLENKSSSKLK